MFTICIKKNIFCFLFNFSPQKVFKKCFNIWSECFMLYHGLYETILIDLYCGGAIFIFSHSNQCDQTEGGRRNQSGFFLYHESYHSLLVLVLKEHDQDGGSMRKVYLRYKAETNIYLCCKDFQQNTSEPNWSLWHGKMVGVPFN